eukprot:14850-Heterococcus_DN1.PRE.3
MPRHDAFSYETDNERVFSLNQQFKAKLVHLDAEIASLAFLNAHDLELADVPAGFSLRRTNSGANAARMGNNLLICWAASYEVLYDGHEVMQLHNDRQQTFHTEY